MCGIAGFFGAGDEADIRRMTEALRHRGPDDSGVEILPDKRVFLGHRRLSIVDLAAPPQPMWDANCEACIVYNGEVYNQKDLRRELAQSGRRFLNDTDTEVVLNACLEWGFEQALKKMNGMFAMAVYFAKTGDIFLARDRFGKKPLFYFVHPEGFAFASELSSLIRHPACPRQIDSHSVAKYFAFNSVVAPHSVLKGVKKLLPGHSLHFSPNTSVGEPKPFFRYVLKEDNSISEDEALEEFSRRYRKAVHDRLMSDVPLGVFLSGGIDSTSVVRALVEADVRPTCYSIGFEDSSFDESSQAAETASYYNLPHRIRTFSDREVEDRIATALKALDEPMGDASIVPTYLLCQFAREEVTVALGGDGGDEIFAGYDPFTALAPTRLLSGAKGAPARALAVMIARMLPTRHGNMTAEFRLRRWLRAFDYPSKCWVPSWLSALDAGRFSKVMPNAPSLTSLFLAETNQACIDRNPKHPGEEAMYYFLHGYMPDSVLCKVDRASMKNSLEVRAPFLDVNLAEFVARLPWKMKYKWPKGKLLLRKWLKQNSPQSVHNRPKKGFGIPVARWLAGPMRDRMEEVLKPESLEEIGFDPTETLTVWNDHLNFREDQRAFLWNLLVFDDWKKRILQK